jgi:hypothetical protein
MRPSYSKLWRIATKSISDFGFLIADFHPALESYGGKPPSFPSRPIKGQEEFVRTLPNEVRLNQKSAIRNQKLKNHLHLHLHLHF